jgi:CHASE2 domain-containing sensor protein
VLISANMQRDAVSEHFDSWALSAGFTMRGPRAVPSDIVIVSLDPDSKIKLNLPETRAWPRDAVARLLIHLKRLGAESIFTDVFLTSRGFSDEEDEALLSALREVKPVLMTKRNPVTQSPDKVPYVPGLDPLPIFAEAATKVVSAILWDGEPIDDSRRFMSAPFGPELYRVPLLATLSPNSVARWDPPGISDFINFYGPPGTIPVVSAFDVLTDARGIAEHIAGKAVFIGIATTSGVGGASAPDVSEEFRTPVSYMFGVEILATIYENLRHASWIRRAPTLSMETTIVLMGSFLVNCALCMAHGRLRVLLMIFVPALWLCEFFMLFAKGIFFSRRELGTRGSSRVRGDCVLARALPDSESAFEY